MQTSIGANERQQLRPSKDPLPARARQLQRLIGRQIRDGVGECRVHAAYRDPWSGAGGFRITTNPLARSCRTS
jgi:hypothetical protein